MLMVNLFLLKITGLAHVTPKLGIECVIISFRAWFVRDYCAVRPLEKRGGTHASAVLTSQVKLTQSVLFLK